MRRWKDEPPAVRVYTVCDESRYLIVRNVPALRCIDELVKLFGSYGEISEYRILDEEEREQFTEVCWIKFSQVGNARFAKRKLDEYVFYGNRLQVSYAPQYEILSDTKEKLEIRRREVLSRLHSGNQKPPKSKAPQRDIFGPLLPPVYQKNYVLDQLKPLEGQSSTSGDVNVSSMPSSSGQYFPLASMNETVQLVREKLDKGIIMRNVLRYNQQVLSTVVILKQVLP
ncbi:uncharacterized protein LOC116265005 isoform X2 [Nymphaea colorata]|uniref:uncharacterized protein LOC116265005 isoform X2 n=1 Tax=Nymphaea colorata TaxID=210225 RepID=UPI00129D552E|nr:uncharacterized protein LOC116265005 isoform X2 [Nymphaea colorata]